MNKSLLLPAITATLILTGCAPRVVFTTQTSLGLDVSGTASMPNKISLSYNRFEGAIVPTKTNGEAHSVYGGMDADITFFSGQTIRQTFATGNAAILATKGAPDPKQDGRKPTTGGSPLIFLTGTTFGLHLTAGESSTPPNMLLGYRRSEATEIPLPDPGEEVRSVYADILINSASSTASDITTNFSSLKGVRIKQSFATGRAAEQIATTPDIQDKLDQAAGNAQAAVNVEYTNVERILTYISTIDNKVDGAKLKTLTPNTGLDDKWVTKYANGPIPTLRVALRGKYRSSVNKLADNIKP